MSVICIDEILEKDQERQKALELDKLKSSTALVRRFCVENKISADDA
jgi:hypothetical protein